MDQKTATALDPKLKEVYDRVMGTSAAPSAPITPSAPVAPAAAMPTNPAASSLPPLTPPSSSIGLTPPITTSTGSTPANPPTNGLPPMKNTLPPLPEKPLMPPSAPLGANPQASSGQAAPKPTVDYAAIAAKYATPLPTINANYGTLPSRQGNGATVTPSTTTYGVVNGGSTGNVGTTKEKNTETEKSGSSLKKVLLIVGIPIFIIAYSAIWIMVFKVDVASFLPL